MSTTLDGINTSSSAITATTGPVLVTGATSTTTEAKPRRGRPRRPKVTDDTRQAARALFCELARLFPEDDLYQFEQRMRPVVESLWAITTWHFAYPQCGPAWLDSHRQATEADKRRLAEADRIARQRMAICGAS